MTKFDGLIGLLDELNNDSFGEWKIDCEHKGTPEDPIHFPFPIYTEAVRNFIKAVYDFDKNNPEFDLHHYHEVMEKYGLNNIETADIDKLNAEAIMALLMWVVRGERFCDGLILSHLQKGIIQELLVRLRNIADVEV